VHLNNDWPDDWMAEVGVRATVDNPGVSFLDDEPILVDGELQDVAKAPAGAAA
jgi:hypothetical protein